MSLTSRDRKILLVLAPLLVALAYWFLILGPKRDEASQLGEQLTEQEQKRDEAKADAERLSAAQAGFRTQYASIVRLGKAIPSTVDMPGLIVQLDKAARGTGIRFSKIAAGQRTPAATTGTTGSTDPNAPAAPGGQAAQSAPGKATENAANKVDEANKKESERDLEPGDTQTSKSARDGGLPVGGGEASKTAGGSAGTGATGVPGLDTVPLQLTFDGSYFDLADFFHRLKRFVRVANDRILVKGRLLTIDSFSFNSSEGGLSTEITATVYLVPKNEGVAAGATPNGPSSGGTPASGQGSGGGTKQTAQVTR